MLEATVDESDRDMTVGDGAARQHQHGEAEQPAAVVHACNAVTSLG